MIDRAADHHDVVPVAVGVGSAGPIEPNVESISPLNIGGVAGLPVARATAGARPASPSSAISTRSRSPSRRGGSVLHRATPTSSRWSCRPAIGGGVVLNGQLVDGATGNAGHVGHIVVEPNGRRCACGSRGCLEAEASGRAIEAITGRPPTEPSYETMQRTGDLVGRGRRVRVQPPRPRPRRRRRVRRARLRRDVLQLCAGGARPRTPDWSSAVAPGSHLRDSATGARSSVPVPSGCAECGAERAARAIDG